MYTFSILNFNVNANKVVKSENEIRQDENNMNNNGTERTLKNNNFLCLPIWNKQPLAMRTPTQWRGKKYRKRKHQHTNKINRTPKHWTGVRMKRKKNTHTQTQHMKLRTKEVQAYHKLRALFYLQYKCVNRTKKAKAKAATAPATTAIITATKSKIQMNQHAHEIINEEKER